MANEVEIIVETHRRGDNLNAIAEEHRRAFRNAGRNSGSAFREGIRESSERSGGTSFLASLLVGSSHGLKRIIRKNLAEALATPVVGPIILTTLGGAVTAIMPLIGAAAAGTFVTAFGVGLTALPATFAAKTEDVEKRMELFSTRMKTHLTNTSSHFEETWTDSIGVVETLLTEMLGSFSESSRFLAPETTEFVRDFADGIRELEDSIMPLSRAWKAIMDELGPQLPDMFREISFAINKVAESIEDNPETFVMLIRWLGHLISDVLEFVAALNDLANWFEEHPMITESLIIALEAVIAPFQLIMRIIEELQNLTGNYGKDIETTWNHMNEFAQATREATNALVNHGEALKEQTDPTFALFKAQTRLREAQEDYNEAVKEHGRKSPEAREALMKMAEAAINLQIATGKAAGTFDGKLSPAMRATLKAAGLTEAEIALLEQQFIDAHKAGEKFAKDYTANVNVRFRYFGDPRYAPPGAHILPGQASTAGLRHGGISGAMGMPNVSGAQGGGPRGNMVWVGETGAELVELPFGSRVIPSGQSKAMAESWTGKRVGGGSFKFISDGTSVGELLLTLLKYHVRTEYNGDWDRAIEVGP